MTVLKIPRVKRLKIKISHFFQRPKAGCFQEPDRGVCDYLTAKRNEEMPITRADIQLKAFEITE